MAKVLSAIAIGIAVNLDNLILATAYSKKKMIISWKYNVIISSVTVVMTLLALFIGNHIFKFIENSISSVISGIALIFLGIFYLFPYIFKKKKKDKNDAIVCKKLNFSGILGISLVLSINNIPTSLAYSMDGASILLLSVIFFLCSTFFIYLGGVIAKKVPEIYTTIISSILLIILGITEILVK